MSLWCHPIKKWRENIKEKGTKLARSIKIPIRKPLLHFGGVRCCSILQKDDQRFHDGTGESILTTLNKNKGCFFFSFLFWARHEDSYFFYFVKKRHICQGTRACNTSSGFPSAIAHFFTFLKYISNCQFLRNFSQQFLSIASCLTQFFVIVDQLIEHPHFLLLRHSHAHFVASISKLR